MDNQQPSPKSTRHIDRERKRAARACDGCRRQKERCDGGVPCRRCFRLGRQCDFTSRASVDTESQAGSGSRPGANISAEQAKRLEYLERIVQGYVGSKDALDLETLKGLAQGVEKRRNSPRPADISSQSSEFDGVDEKFDIQPLHGNVTHYSGEFSHWNFSMRIKKWIDQSVPNDSSNYPSKSATTFKEYYRAEELQSHSDAMGLLSLLPPRPIADFLVYSFFKHAQTNYFFVEQNWLRAKLDLAYENAAAFTRRDVGVSLVDGVENPTEKGSDAFTEDAVGVLFYQQAARLLSDVITVSSLECVQACLLLGIYTLPVDASGLAYIYLNLALKLAIQNGMHRKYTVENRDADVVETRNRVWWTVYTIEKRVGIFHGRPTSISGTDVDADFPVHHPDLWSSTSQTDTAHILATFELNQQLSKLSREITILRSLPKHEVPEGLKRLAQLHRELKSWWDALPVDIFCKEFTSQSKISRKHMHLQLEYCLVRMFVGRVFIFPEAGLRDGSSPATSANAPSSASLSKKGTRATLVADCVEAALSVIDTCRCLRNTIGLARASYTEFSSCRAALMVVTTQCLSQKTYMFRQALRDGLSMLKEMSTGSLSAHSEMSLIEAFEQAIANMNAQEQTASSMVSESEYAKFKKWEQLWKNDAPTAMSESVDGSVQGKAVSTAPPEPEPPRPMAQVPKEEGMMMPPSTPFFGVDGHFASFPQSLDDFTAFFGNEFGTNIDSGHG
ncbi:N-terminal binuclear Zn cluster-containing protein [Trichoderma citrinoviride]|uniref:N-terminal binuclear Zn cluster-containing protein n=1 Tax=Trichoderma citrinoviride TaxID=58853 RepID=A0A2T4BJF8_9HYPO|nr:N-terminal binuclear Zn cluster-containing protein [Trichoderma citrinoviride]PTB69428.1 N-terminal binuclear Zn cluster-containing protein [Trichoderma citrinoviride]